MKTLKTKSFKGTWLGSKAVATEYLLEKAALGLRVVEMCWEDGTTTVKLIKGDGRKANFQVFAEGAF